ncbi:LytTR family DNA-binding domain-containing protein [Mariniflexile soesokkakense]|uniref:LytTR family DNA-binding domain-containing protein n=1 Tax=Mariniflexile soesokkakense TaxID=1343160 RepID=A0ABV0A813_9FLAO
MIKAIIIDDEQHCIDRVEKLLKPFEDSISLIGKFSTVNSGIKAIDNLNPDVVFLDVQIHEKTGFDVLMEVNHHAFEVIFTTAFETFAVQAFKFSAVDYLLKPIDEDDFNLAIKKLNSKIESKDFTKKVNALLSNVSKSDGQKKITIPTIDGLEFLEVSDIIRCEADVNYTNIFTKDSKKIMVSKTLKSFEALLANCNFFRVHNSHLINLDYIKKYTKGKGGYVTLIDNSVIEVSTRRKEDFLKAIS